MQDNTKRAASAHHSGPKQEEAGGQARRQDLAARGAKNIRKGQKPEGGPHF